MDFLIIIILIGSGIYLYIYFQKYTKLVSQEKTIKDMSNKLKYMQNKKKGDEYEKKVGRYYKKLGYEVNYHGLEKDRNDQGIDLICKKDDEILFVQCKNWEQEKSITAKHVKEFYGSCHFYVDKNQIDFTKVSCIYAIPKKKLLNFQAEKLFQKHYLNCRYQVVSV